MNKPINIALTDDHVLFRKGMRILLEEIEGINVVLEAINGEELLQKMAEITVDVVLLDLEMPVLDGMSTLPILIKDFPKVKTLILTMHNEERFIRHLMEAGANGYLSKDADLEEVEKAIKSVVKDGHYFNNKISKVLLNALTTKKGPVPELKNEIKLTKRELDILSLICREMTTSEIAEEIHLSPRTIEGYRNRLLEKTGAKNAAGLVLFAIRNGLFDPKE